MIKPQDDSKVKRKRRTILKGVALTNADIAKVAERHGWSKKRAETEVKREYENLINGHPELTSATKRLAIKLSWWFMPDKRFARASIPTLAAALKIGHRTVERASATLHEQQIVFTESGGPSRRGSLGAVANKYVAHLRLVINPDTGELIKHRDYDIAARNSIVGLKSYRQNEGMNSYRQNDGTLKRSNPCGASSRTVKMRESTVVQGGASLPASTDVPANAARPKDQSILSGINTPMPVDAVDVKPLYIVVQTLEAHLKVTIKELITGKARQEFLDLVKAEAYTFGEAGNWIYDEQRPNPGTPYGHIIVNDDSGDVSYVEGQGRIDLSDLKPTDLLVIEYRPSSATTAAMDAKLKQLIGG